MRLPLVYLINHILGGSTTGDSKNQASCSKYLIRNEDHIKRMTLNNCLVSFSKEFLNSSFPI